MSTELNEYSEKCTESEALEWFQTHERGTFIPKRILDFAHAEYMEQSKKEHAILDNILQIIDNIK